MPSWMEVSIWCFWSPRSSTGAKQTAPLVGSHVNYMMARLHCTAPPVFITTAKFGMKQKIESSKGIKDFQEACSENARSCSRHKRWFLKLGPDDGEAKSQDWKHWIINESVFLCPLWSAFSWTVSWLPTIDQQPTVPVEDASVPYVPVTPGHEITANNKPPMTNFLYPAPASLHCCVLWRSSISRKDASQAPGGSGLNLQAATH